jgi:hypothetical protein
VHLASGQEFIVIEESRARMVLSDWQHRVKDRSAWHTPLGLCIALASTLATSSFTDQPWASKGTLKGFFFSCLLASVGWLIYELYRAGRSKSTSLDELITELKKGTRKIDLVALGQHAQGEMLIGK